MFLIILNCEQYCSGKCISVGKKSPAGKRKHEKYSKIFSVLKMETEKFKNIIAVYHHCGPGLDSRTIYSFIYLFNKYARLDSLFSGTLK
jgi:hypothetical protein